MDAGRDTKCHKGRWIGRRPGELEWCLILNKLLYRMLGARRDTERWTRENGRCIGRSTLQGMLHRMRRRMWPRMLPRMLAGTEDAERSEDAARDIGEDDEGFWEVQGTVDVAKNTGSNRLNAQRVLPRTLHKTLNRT